MGGAGLAVIDKAEAGPQFGAEGLIIPLQQGQEQVGKSRLGSYYARRADGGRTLFAAGEEKRAQLVDLKVRCCCLEPLSKCCRLLQGSQLSSTQFPWSLCWPRREVWNSVFTSHKGMEWLF